MPPPGLAIDLTSLLYVFALYCSVYLQSSGPSTLVFVPGPPQPRCTAQFLRMPNSSIGTQPLGASIPLTIDSLLHLVSSSVQPISPARSTTVPVPGCNGELTNLLTNLMVPAYPRLSLPVPCLSLLTPSSTLLYRGFLHRFCLSCKVSCARYTTVPLCPLGPCCHPHDEQGLPPRPRHLSSLVDSPGQGFCCLVTKLHYAVPAGEKTWRCL